jgi:hypothetical protein
MVGRKGSSELSLAAAPGHDGSLTVAQRGDRCMLSPSQDSPGRGQWCGGRATAVKKRRWYYSVRVVLGHGEKRRRARRGVVEDDRALPLYRGRGGATAGG